MLLRCALRSLVVLVVSLVFGALLTGRAGSRPGPDGPPQRPEAPDGEIQPF